ncbi:MAG: NADP-dependent phosphogluconate dehydrogenase [Erysipelotrichaceae bacterium]
MKNDVGVIGLSVMGRNLVYNLLDHHYLVAGYNRSSEVTKQLNEENHSLFHGFEDIDEFLKSLSKPRKIILLIKEGSATQSVVNLLLDKLEEGDILIDCGNAHYQDSISRSHDALKKGVFYYSAGISGGAKGARYGASIMPSGNVEQYVHIQSILEDISAKKDHKPCCIYLGESGAGHFVKMIHNAIEYAVMQLLAEVYIVLNPFYTQMEISDIFAQWNKEHPSYLLEITSEIFKSNFESKPILELIEDVSGHKKTGMWASMYALEHGLDASLLISAFQARATSSHLVERAYYHQEVNSSSVIDLDSLHQAYLLMQNLSYIQGFNLIKDASVRYGWQLNLQDVAFIWQAGCIIQGEVLTILLQAMVKEEKDELLLSSWMKRNIEEKKHGLSKVVEQMVIDQYPCPCFINGLTYINQLQSSLLGANLIQAQRDYFGQHGIKFKGKDTVIHYEW